jgi:threonine synthase
MVVGLCHPAHRARRRISAVDTPRVSDTGERLAASVLRCAACGRTHRLDERAWCCAACGGVLDLHGPAPSVPPPGEPAGRAPGLWRFREALPLPPEREFARVSMGEGGTPVVAVPGSGGPRVKLDQLMPTGSFKDRGAVLLVALAGWLGVDRVVADSSGNAGSAVAAYAARAGIGCEVFVPEGTSAGKVGQLRAYGARVHQVPGSREDTAAAAVAAVRERGLFYASHVHQPVFLHGTASYLLEMWEQGGGRLPDTVVVPVGNGTLLLGAYLAATWLRDAGRIERRPRLVGVQSASCAPLAEAFRAGSAGPAGGTWRPTVAEGIAIAAPARGPQILAAVRDTGGAVLTVTDEQVRAAHAALARHGLYVEPTSAVCWAACTAPDAAAHGIAGPDVVVPLCGSGLKSTPPA